MSSGDWLSGKASVVGIGHTPYGKRGQYVERGSFSLVIEAVQKACDDAGIDPRDIDGWTSYSNDVNQGGLLASAFGTKRLRFTGMGWGGGGGAMGGAYLYAAMAVATGQADYVAVVRGVTMPDTGRFGRMGTTEGPAHGLMTPGQAFALAARRHMHRFGTTTDDFAQIAINARQMASTNPDARFRDLITLEDHHNSPMICDPLHKLDFCMESEFGTCVIITSTERAQDLKQTPVRLLAAAMGAPPRWGDAMFGGWGGGDEMVGGQFAPDDDYVTGGYRTIADDLYAKAGVGPADIDAAQIYDHFTPMVLMGLEDFQFCKKGEGGPFLRDGNIGLGAGKLALNTHGGNLAEVYAHGMTHVFEAVRQVRGTSTNQVPNAEVSLVAAGSSMAPTSAMIFGR
ncbi:MAG: lipid-transfer protein [Pseudonocardiales bacterium]|nr:lipid-transfer protein [Pseudonocardiales bacterium]